MLAGYLGCATTDEYKGLFFKEDSVAKVPVERLLAQRVVKSGVVNGKKSYDQLFIFAYLRDDDCLVWLDDRVPFPIDIAPLLLSSRFMKRSGKTITAYVRLLRFDSLGSLESRIKPSISTRDCTELDS